MAVTGLARFLQQLKTDDWLSPLVDALNARQEPERWLEPNLDIHPSSSGSPCARDIQLSMLGYRGAVAAQNRRRMDNGTATHDRWNEYLFQSGVLVKANVRIVQTEPFPWNGECDVILERPDTLTKHVGELKSMNEHRWKAVPDQLNDRRAMARLLLQTERSYVYQLTQYIVKLGPLEGTERDGLFIFENTNDQSYKVRYIEPDDQLRSEAFARPLEAQTACQDGFLIESPFARKSPTCRKCYREAVCYNIADGDKELNDIVRRQLALIAEQGRESGADARSQSEATGDVLVAPISANGANADDEELRQGPCGMQDMSTELASTSEATAPLEF